jgi:hypothetical protein
MNPTFPTGMPTMPGATMGFGPTDTFGMMIQLVMEAVPLLCVLIYLSPVIVAILRKTPAAGTVFLINLFLGWTVIGWFVALAWSYVGGGQQTLVVAATSGGAPISTLAPAPTKWWHLAVKIVGGVILLVMLLGFYLIFTSPVSPEMQQQVGAARKSIEQKPAIPQGVPQNAEELFGP